MAEKTSIYIEDNTQLTQKEAIDKISKLIAKLEEYKIIGNVDFQTTLYAINKENSFEIAKIFLEIGDLMELYAPRENVC